MISILVLSIILTVSGADANCNEVPNCASCEYNNGIGFVRSNVYCDAYFVCSKNPDGGYFYELMCCPLGQRFDKEHLTCNPNITNFACDTNRGCCPNITTPSAVDCPYFMYYPDPHYFVMPGGKVVPCPMSEVWDQKACSCVRGPSFVPNDDCCKILHFKFNGIYDSYSCYNFAKGEPQNYPLVDNDVLCLDGNKSQSVAVPFLDNWFAWNPIGKNFTLCIWICPKYQAQTCGVLSTNCDFVFSKSVLEVLLGSGELVVFIDGLTPIFLGKFPPKDKFSKLCVTYDNGLYTFYYNGQFVLSKQSPNTMPVNSHSATSLGFVEGKKYFSGYLDDFCFWTKVLPASEILDCYNKGPSNMYKTTNTLG